MSAVPSILTQICAAQRKSSCAINRHNGQLFDLLVGAKQDQSRGHAKSPLWWAFLALRLPQQKLQEAPGKAISRVGSFIIRPQARSAPSGALGALPLGGGEPATLGTWEPCGQVGSAYSPVGKIDMHCGRCGASGSGGLTACAVLFFASTGGPDEHLPSTARIHCGAQ